MPNPTPGTFADFWSRAGLPAAQRHEFAITWDSAIIATCERHAARLGVPLERLLELTRDMRGIA
jgi:hypothetical protein